MIANIEFMKKNFPILNKRFFDGELEEPKFALISSKCKLGLFQATRRLDIFGLPLDRPTISLSIYFDRTEHDLLETLCHEMIHLYTHVNNLPTDHGKCFKDKASEINGKSDFNITRTTSVSGCAINPTFGKKAKNEELVFFAAHRVGKNKWLYFTCTKDKEKWFLDYLNKEVKKNSCYSISKYYKTYVDKGVFPNLPLCRKNISGNEVSQKELEDTILTKLNNPILYDKTNVV